MDRMTFIECERIGFGMLKKTGAAKHLIAPAAGAADYLLALLREDGRADEGAEISSTGAVYPYGREESQTVWIWQGD